MADSLAKAAANDDPEYGEIETIEVDELPDAATVWLATPTDSRDVAAWAWQATREQRSDKYDLGRAHKGYTPLTQIPKVLGKPSSQGITKLTLSEKVRVIKARYHFVATRRRKVVMGILPWGSSEACTLCTKGKDTVGHRLLKCGDKMVSGMITNRHNWVVRYLAGVYMRGRRGGWLCRFNVGSGDRGSSHHTVPRWMLDSGPDCPMGTEGSSWRKELIKVGKRVTPEIKKKKLGKVPDIVIISGVRPTHGEGIDHWTQVPRARKVKVKILEVGYACDDGWEARTKEKEQKYLALVTLLGERGWDVEFRTLVLGASGVVYEHTLDILEWLGEDRRKARERHTKAIARHGAKEASDILATYEEQLKTVPS